MDTKNKLLGAAIAAAVGVALTMSAVPAQAAKANMEKCYGVVKAKKNDCGTAKHSCAAQATKSGDSQEWIYVAKGLCNKLVNGSLKSGK